jgi:hypothetical protein
LTTEEVGGVLLLLLPISFNVFFFLLGKHFEYPDILRKPVDHVLRAFPEGGSALKLMWLGLMLTAVLFAPAVVVLHVILAAGASTVLAVATTIGVLSAVVQFLGLARWPFLVPYLARTHQDPSASQGTKDAVAVVFESFNRYGGVGIGEHLGYLFTGLWTTLIGIVMLDTSVFHDSFGIIGIALGIALMFGALEFVGPKEEEGFKLAGAVIPLAYIAWSVWLMAMGVSLLA